MTPAERYRATHPERVKDAQRRYRQRHRERLRAENAERMRRSRQADPEREKAIQANWRERHREKLREKSRHESKAAYDADPAKKLARCASYKGTPRGKAVNAAVQARRRSAFVPWADPVAIKALYAEAARLTAETGIAHEVDHVVPLQHPLVCGLHVEGNLQILPAEVNRAKGNQWPWSAK